MYPMTRESVVAAISRSGVEKAVCVCDGRKKGSRRIFRRLTHLAVGGRVIGGSGIGEGNLGFGSSAEDCELVVSRLFRLPHGVRLVRDENRSLASGIFFQGRQMRAGGSVAGPRSHFPEHK